MLRFMRGRGAAAAATMLLAAPAAAHAWVPGTYTTGRSPNGVVAADFNGDGRPDLGVIGGVSDDLNVLIAGPGGAFQTSAPSPLGGDGSNFAAAGDFDGVNGLGMALANFPTNPGAGARHTPGMLP